MKLLIVYGSTEGHTRKVASFLARQAEQADHSVSLVESAANEISPLEYDAVIIAASIHAGQYKNEIVDYVNLHSEALNTIPSAFFSIGLSITRKDEKVLKELELNTKFFLDVTKWNPLFVEQVAGALQYSKYGFIKKMLIRSIMKKAGGDTDTSRDYEYTDWDKLKVKLDEFIREAEPIGAAH